MSKEEEIATQELEKTLANLKKLIKPPKEKEEEVRKQLSPLFADFYPSSSKFLLYKQYKPRFSEKITKTFGFFIQLSKIMKAVEDDVSKSDFGVVFLNAMNYLLVVELIGNAYIDQTILLLTASGVDLHMEPDSKHRYTIHVASLEDLETPALSLSVKLDFLHSNGLTFFSK